MPLAQSHREALIAACPLFAGLDGDGMAAVAQATVEVEFAADRTIARQGEIGTGLFIVADGAVRVVRDGEIIAHLGPGEFFGELSVLDGGPRNASVIADGPRSAWRSRPGTPNGCCVNSRAWRWRSCGCSRHASARPRRTTGPRRRRTGGHRPGAGSRRRMVGVPAGDAKRTPEASRRPPAQPATVDRRSPMSDHARPRTLVPLPGWSATAADR